MRTVPPFWRQVVPMGAISSVMPIWLICMPAGVPPGGYCGGVPLMGPLRYGARLAAGAAVAAGGP